MKRAALVVNAMPGSRFTPQEARALGALSSGPPPLGPAARAAELSARRLAEAERQLARARAAIDLPLVVLPLLPAPRWGPEEVEALAAAAQAAPWPEGDA
jgi:hypothetical protein